jgi:cytochrome c oxidase accessory protein FixG
MKTKDLPLDRLATTDRLGNRIYLYPTDVRGKWKTLRSRLSVFMIVIFLGLPWVRIRGHQAVLLDIPNRKFAVFGLTFWAHDAPILLFVVGGAVILLAFVTAIWGRIWCGWACPQTVFLEHVFRRIERWIEGDSLARRKLDQSPASLEKIVKKTLKWGCFTILALILSHSFLAYFVGTEKLASMMEQSPFQNPASFLVMAGVALAILFDLGWFREQFCTVVCPYGRFQSVLMDDQSTVVAYDVKRGEPRKGIESKNSPTGDCVNCYRCVQVCPTGIDIRRGVQLECIACTACMDACDDVMARLKKPLGLIRYGNQSVTEGKIEVSVPWFKRPRTWVYLSLLFVCIGGLVHAVLYRAPIELMLIRAVDFPYQEIPGTRGQAQVLNHFKVDLRNQTFEEQEISFSISSHLQSQGVTIVTSNHKGKLAPGEPERADLFVQFPKTLLTKGRGSMEIQLEARSKLASEPNRSNWEVHLVGPLR